MRRFHTAAATQQVLDAVGRASIRSAAAAYCATPRERVATWCEVARRRAA